MSTCTLTQGDLFAVQRDCAAQLAQGARVRDSFEYWLERLPGGRLAAIADRQRTTWQQHHAHWQRRLARTGRSVCQVRREHQQQGLKQVADRALLELLKRDDESAQLERTEHRPDRHRVTPEQSVARQLATVRTPNAPARALANSPQGAP